MRIILNSGLMALGCGIAYAAKPDSDDGMPGNVLELRYENHVTFEWQKGRTHYDQCHETSRVPSAGYCRNYNYEDLSLDYTFDPEVDMEYSGNLDEVLVRKWVCEYDPYGKCYREQEQLVWINLHTEKPITFRSNGDEWWYVEGQYNWRVLDTKFILQRNCNGNWRDETSYRKEFLGRVISWFHSKIEGSYDASKLIEGALGLRNELSEKIPLQLMAPTEEDKAKLLNKTLPICSNQPNKWRLRPGRNFVHTRDYFTCGKGAKSVRMHTLDIILKTGRWEQFKTFQDKWIEQRKKYICPLLD